MNLKSIALGWSLLLGSAALASAAEWDPALLEGGFMFRDAKAFGDYVRNSEVVAIGRLSAWNKLQGEVRVEKVLRGAPLETQGFRYSGGLALKPVQGDKVLVLLRKKEGKWLLHSFCSAPGLYVHSEPLEELVARELEEQK